MELRPPQRRLGASQTPNRRPIGALEPIFQRPWSLIELGHRLFERLGSLSTIFLLKRPGFRPKTFLELSA